MIGGLFACEDRVRTPDPVVVDYRPVRVIWQGDFAVDGCGFFVKVDSISYRPVNPAFLDSALINPPFDTIVTMRYLNLRRTITSSCGEGGPFEINALEVLDIR